MPAFMSALDCQTYALMRIVVGLLFMWHGMQKLFEFPGSPPPVPSFVTYNAGPIELVGGLLVAVGLFAGWAAFFCSGLMAAAYWMAHGTQALFPIVNGGELAALYCFVFLFIASQGSGIWSVDAERGQATGPIILNRNGKLVQKRELGNRLEVLPKG